MRCPPARTTALALTAVLGLWAGPGLAASLAVVDEGDGVFAYELVLEPGEVVAGIQLDLITDGATFAVLDTGFAVSIGRIGPLVLNPWSLTSWVAPVVSGNIRLAHTYEQSGDTSAGWSRTHEVQPGGLRLTNREFLEQQGGAFPFFCASGCFADFEPTGLPVARLLVQDGPAPARYTASICVPVAGATCNFPETNVPEPVVLVLLPLGMFLATRRRGVE